MQVSEHIRATKPAATPRKNTLDRWWTPGMIFIILAAYALRVFGLARQGLWWDEGFSLYHAHLPLSQIAQALSTEDIHPPLYFYLLRSFTALAGSSSFSSRYLSLLFSVAVVVLTYLLGRRLFTPVVGVLGAVLTTIMPLQILYAQEVRMYPELAFWVLLSLYSFVRIWFTPGPLRRRRWWAVYALATTAALYSHYYAGLVPLCSNLYLLTTLLRPRGAALWRWLGLQVVVVIAFLPWLAITIGYILPYIGFKSHKNIPLDPLSFAWKIWLELYIGRDENLPLALLAGIVFGILAITGTFAGRKYWRRRARLGPLLLASVVIGPLLLGALVNLRYPFFASRFFLPVGAPASLLVAIGIYEYWRRRWVGMLLVPAALVVSSLTLYSYETHLIYPGQDYRPTIQTLMQLEQPGDRILLSYRWQVGYLQSLYHGPNRYSFVEPQTFEAAAQDARRVWLLGDRPSNSVEVKPPMSFLQHLHPLFGTQNNNARLLLYGPQQSSFASAPLVAGNLRQSFVDAGTTIRLLGFSLLGAGASPSGALQPGSKLLLRFLWQAEQIPQLDYTVFVHLVDARGQTFAVADSYPGGGQDLRVTYPTSQWDAGEIVLDEHILSIPDHLPLGVYHLEIGLYKEPGTLRLRLQTPGTTTATAVPLDEFVVPSNLHDLPSDGRADGARFGASDRAIILVGSTLPATITVHPGQSLSYTLYWRATGRVLQDYTLFVHLLDSSGHLAFAADAPPLSGSYPTHFWRAGPMYPDSRHLQFPRSLSPGLYTLELGWYDPTTGVRLALTSAAPPGATSIRHWQVQVR